MFRMLLSVGTKRKKTEICTFNRMLLYMCNSDKQRPSFLLYSLKVRRSVAIRLILQPYFWPEPLGASNRTPDQRQLALWHCSQSDISPNKNMPLAKKQLFEKHQSPLTGGWWVISHPSPQKWGHLPQYLWHSLLHHKGTLPLRCPGGVWDDDFRVHGSEDVFHVYEALMS